MSLDRTEKAVLSSAEQSAQRVQKIRPIVAVMMGAEDPSAMAAQRQNESDSPNDDDEMEAVRRLPSMMPGRLLTDQASQTANFGYDDDGGFLAVRSGDVFEAEGLRLMALDRLGQGVFSEVRAPFSSEERGGQVARHALSCAGVPLRRCRVP